MSRTRPKIIECTAPEKREKNDMASNSHCPVSFGGQQLNHFVFECVTLAVEESKETIEELSLTHTKRHTNVQNNAE